MMLLDMDTTGTASGTGRDYKMQPCYGIFKTAQQAYMEPDSETQVDSQVGFWLSAQQFHQSTSNIGTRWMRCHLPDLPMAPTIILC